MLEGWPCLEKAKERGVIGASAPARDTTWNEKGVTVSQMKKKSETGKKKKQANIFITSGRWIIF
jgi:hypothetical protein